LLIKLSLQAPGKQSLKYTKIYSLAILTCE